MTGERRETTIFSNRGDRDLRIGDVDKTLWAIQDYD